MRALVVQTYLSVRASYWFIPTVMAFGAAGLAAGTVLIDARVGTGWSGGFALLTANRAEGARALLATIAGSMITVAGVTFSMTILAVSSAGSQFGPRLIGNFMRDRGNQWTLGTLIGVFVYCLMVLRTVRSAEEGVDGSAFVPHISILTGLGLALCGVAVLIYFFHHVPETINISRITARVGRRLVRDLASVFPAEIGGSASAVAAPGFEDAEQVLSERTGYVVSISADSILKWAVEHEAVVRLRVRPGDFVRENDGLAEVMSGSGLTGHARKELCRVVGFGEERTPTQNVLFLVDQLVEMLGRALSPGVNDPFTAINCLDWMGAGLAVAMSGLAVDPERRDADGRVRVVVRPMSFGDLASAMFDQSRPYIARDRNAVLHTIRVIAEGLHRCRGDEGQTRILWGHAEKLAGAAEEALAHEMDRETVRERMGCLRAGLSGSGIDDEFVAATGWLGGHG